MAKRGPWSYVLVFSDSVGTREEVRNFIKSRQEVVTWYLCMSNAIFFRSYKTATELQGMFREFTRDKGRFVILDCDTDRNGWLPRSAWGFLRGQSP